MLISHKSVRATKPAPGITRRVLAHTEKVMLTEHTLEKDAILPDHQHSHEQLVYLKSGEILIEMGGEHFKLLPGDSLAVPPDVNHKVTSLKKSVALDIFAPARKDFL